MARKSQSDSAFADQVADVLTDAGIEFERNVEIGDSRSSEDMRADAETPDDRAAREGAEYEAEAAANEQAIEDNRGGKDLESPVGSQTVTDAARAEYLTEIKELEIIVGHREEEWESAKLATKEAKDSFDAAVDRLRQCIRRKTWGPGPLFEQPPVESRNPLVWEENEGVVVAESCTPDKFFNVTEFGGKFTVDGTAGELMPDDAPGDFDSLNSAQAWCDARDAALWGKIRATSSGVGQDAANRPAVDVASWESTPLIDLKPPIGTRAIKALAEHQPPLMTMGELAAWQTKKGDWWAQDIKGLGASGREQVENAQAGYWQANMRAGNMPGEVRRTVADLAGVIDDGNASVTIFTGGKSVTIDQAAAKRIRKSAQA